MDQHPDIDSAYKFLQWVDQQQPKRPVDPKEILSRQEFLKRYNVSWMIQESSSILGVDGKFFTGVNNILSNQSSFPTSLSLAVDYDTKTITVTTSDNEFFLTEAYKEINFSTE
jgi:hypothetical protein